MPAPVLDPNEIGQLTKQAAQQESFASTLTAAGPAKAAHAADLAVSDGAFKKFFDYYNDQIIGEYDAERKALSGVFIAAPITEADVLGPANIDGTVRTTPSLPATDVVRVTQFDGTPTTTTTTNEQQHISDQAVFEGNLTMGYTPQPTVNPTTVTASSLTSSSTTLMVTDPSTSITFAPGEYFVVHDTTTTSALLKVVTATPGVGITPPFTYNLTVQVIIPPVGTLASGSKVIAFSGFTNSERTTKTPVITALQNIMTFLVTQLQTAINNRIARLNEELTALAANQDPDGVAQIATATTNANTSKTFLTAYLVMTDVSDTGLATLVTERGVRSPFITTRLSQIAANYTGQTKNYYDQRYSFANNRGNTSRGTLRLQKAAESSASTLTSYAANATAAAAALKSILP